MAASFNRVQILGNLGQNPELRYTASQVPVASFSVATREFRNGSDGQKQDYTEWHRIVTWSRVAENCSKYLKKGSSVFIEGRLQTRSWEDQNHIKRYTTEIIANNVQFLSSRDSQDIQTESNSSYSKEQFDNQKPLDNEDQKKGLSELDSDGMDLDKIPF